MSSTTCLSLAPVLRCVSLSHTFTGTLLIPPALGVIFCLALLFRRNGDNKRLLLMAEGIVYLLVALMDLLSEMVPATTFSLSTFKGLDITIGALSDVPILLLSIFFYLFVRSVLVPDLPTNLKRIVSVVFLLVIPATIIVNTFASFVGISYAFINVNGKIQLGVGFSDKHLMDVWNFLQGWTLALLGFTQFIVFCLIIARLAHPRAGQSGTFGRAIIAFGCLIEFVECMVGYAPTTTVVIFVRRSMRSLARALFCIGVLTGGAAVSVGSSNRSMDEKGSLRSRIGSPQPGSLVHVSGEGESVLEKPMAAVQVDPVIQLARARTVIKKMEEAAFNPFDPGRTPTQTPTRPDMDVPFIVQSDAPALPRPYIVARDSDPFADQASKPRSVPTISEPPLQRSTSGRSAKSLRQIDHPYATAVPIIERSPFASDADSDAAPSPTEAVPAARPRARDPNAPDRSAERVTLHWDSASGRAPHLEMRLSGIDLPSPSALLASIQRFEAMRPNSNPTVPGTGAREKPRLPRTNTVAGNLSELRQQYAQEAGPNAMWYPFRGSPTKGLGVARSQSAGHLRSASSLSSSSFSATGDVEAGDPERDPPSRNTSLHSRAQTLGSHHASRAFSVVSGMSYMSDASDFVSHLAPRFPDIPPMPMPVSMPQSRIVSTLGPGPGQSAFSEYSSPDISRGATPMPMMNASAMQSGAVSPFIDPSEETEEDAARAIRGPRDLPALDTAVLARGLDSARSGLAYDDRAGSAASSTRRMGSLDVPMSALDSPELVEVPGTARPPMPTTASTFTSYGRLESSTPQPYSPVDSISSYGASDLGTPRAFQFNSSHSSASNGIYRAGKPADLVSVKSVGSAPRKATPVATPATATRGSVPIEHFSFDLAPHVSTPGMVPHTAVISESPVSQEDSRPWIAQ